MKNLDKTITIVKEYIEEKLGGNVDITKNDGTRIVIFAWTKNDKTIYGKHFGRAYSYEELEKIINPSVVGQLFVEEYEKLSKEMKADVAPVEESVELAKEESAGVDLADEPDETIFEEVEETSEDPEETE